MRKTGHIRERSPGAFELRYSLGRADPATGRRKVATATVRGTRKEAERELRRLLRAVDTGGTLRPLNARIALRSAWALQAGLALHALRALQARYPLNALRALRPTDVADIDPSGRHFERRYIRKQVAP